MLQHENLEQLVHHLVEGTMKDRELASTVLRGLTSYSEIHLAINAIRAHEAKSETRLEKLQDGVVNAVTGICYGSMILACGELVSSLIFDTPLTLTKKALGWGFAGSAAFLAALGLLWMAAWRTHRHLERMAAELDDGVAEQLGNGTIRLLRRGFLLSLHGGLGRCQDLPDHAFLSPAEALSCFRSRSRSVGTLSYRWRSPQNPDPDGCTVEQLKHMLEHMPFIQAVFWDWGSLPQDGPDGTRTNEEKERFTRGLKRMNGLYASVHCTTVLLLMDIPRVQPDSNFPVLNFNMSGWCNFERYVALLAAGCLFRARRRAQRMHGHVLRSQRWLRMLWSVVASLFAGVIVSESAPDDEQREAAKADLRQLIDSHARPKMVDMSGDEPLAVNIAEPPDTEAFRQSLDRATFTNGKSEHSQVVGMFEDIYSRMMGKARKATAADSAAESSVGIQAAPQRLETDPQPLESESEMTRLMSQTAMYSDASAAVAAPGSQHISIWLVLAMLLLSYFDVVSDMAAGTYLLSTPQADYGVWMFCVIAFSFACQALMTVAFGRARMLSKDTLLAAVGLGPALQAYRAVRGQGDSSALTTSLEILAVLKVTEVVSESLPELVLQTLALSESESAHSIQIVSIGASLLASAVLLTDAEVMFNAEVDSRRRYLDYFGYLPLLSEQPARHWRLLVLMALSIGSILMMSTTSAVAAFGTHPQAVGAMLGFSCGLHHAWKLYEGDWWSFGRPLVASVGYAPAITVDLLIHTGFWLLMHSCPIPTVRDPNWVGPHHSCRIALLSFVQAAVCAWLAPESKLVWYCTAPAFAIALVSVSAFLLSVEQRFRVTFWWRDTKRQFYVRQFNKNDANVSIEEQDKDRAMLLRRGRAGLLEEVHSDAVCRWLTERGPVWAASRPVWLTESWVRRLPRTFRLALAEAMGEDEGALAC